jgi:hypothetical protein
MHNIRPTIYCSASLRTKARLIADIGLLVTNPGRELEVRMMQHDPIAQALLNIKFKYADKDPRALSDLERRIGATARDKGLITYTDLVKDVRFHLENVNGGQPFVIDEWTDLHRAIIGDFLGQVNLRSYTDHGFLASALVVDKAEGKPSSVFFRWVRKLAIPGRVTERGLDEFWVEQVKKAYAFYGATQT